MPGWDLLDSILVPSPLVNFKGFWVDLGRFWGACWCYVGPWWQWAGGATRSATNAARPPLRAKAVCIFAERGAQERLFQDFKGSMGFA